MTEPSPVPAPATAPEPAKARRVAALAVIVVAVVAGAAGIGYLAGGGSPAPVAAPTTSAAAARPAAVQTTAPAPLPYPTPRPGEFTLGVKILKKQCFGSAGCNIDFRIEVSYGGDGMDPSKTYEVTYEVKGGEDPLTNTFEVTGDSASVQQEESIGTKRASDKLTAVVTSVSEL